MVNLYRVVFGAALLGVSALSYGATLLVSNGTLIGARDVEVNGLLYDVAFRDGTCAELYNGCDENSDFTFHTPNNDPSVSLAVTTALMTQVFVDGPAGQFDAVPGLTQGCAVDCRISTPVFLQGSISLGIAWAFNSETESRDISTGSGGGFRSVDTRNFTPDNGNYAVWSPASTVVPLPPTLVLFAGSVVGLVGLKARRKSRA
ncbi:MAG: hypothetical protein K0U93_20030 [Gammaproteobacteria bacterium]|nr:hypothetical protein [Gammaproteobacteria bacterium]